MRKLLYQVLIVNKGALKMIFKQLTPEEIAEAKANKEAFENMPIGQLTVAQFRELMAEIDDAIERKKEATRRSGAASLPGCQPWDAHKYSGKKQGLP